MQHSILKLLKTEKLKTLGVFHIDKKQGKTLLFLFQLLTDDAIGIIVYIP